MSATTAPPGWHPDPTNPTGAFRWWDGTAWTAHTQQSPAAAPSAAAPSANAPSAYAPSAYAPVSTTPTQSYANPYGAATVPAQTYANPYAPLPAQPFGTPFGSSTSAPAAGTYYPAGFGGPANVSFAKQNTHSLTAMGVAVAYIAIAMTAHIVFVGIVPIMLSIRAFNSREKLAPFALIAAIVAVVLAFAALR